MENRSKEPLIGSFFRSQAASFVATATDYFVLIFVTEVLGVWYVASAALGAFCGAIVSFFLGRNWAFKRTQEGIGGQLLRYILTSCSSLILNTLGVYLLTEYFATHYILSKTIVSFLVGVGFNFVMYRYFVFK